MSFPQAQSESVRTAMVERGVWALVTLTVAATMLAARPHPLTNDSYRYLDAAAQLRAGHGLTATVAYYDLERAHGRIPFALTHWPPGYPAVIAAASPLGGGDLERAARGISVVATAASAGLLVWTLQMAGVSTLLRGVLLVLYASNAVTLTYATAAASESLFMFVTMASLAALVRAEDRRLSHGSWLRTTAAAACLTGLTYWTRYAGIFVIAAAVSYHLLQWVRQPTRVRALGLALTTVSMGLFGILAARNTWLTGNWRGGNEMPTSHALPGVLRELLAYHLHLAFGDHAFRPGIWEGLLAVAFLGITIAVALDVVGTRDRSLGAATERRAEVAAPLAVGLCVLLYVAGMVYAGATSVIAFSTRMFVPIFPLYLLLAGMGMQWLTARVRSPGARTVLVLSLSLTAVAGAAINARDFSMTPPPAKHRILAEAWDRQDGAAQPLRQWLDIHTPSGEAVLASDGQATGHVLRRPTVGLVTPEYSPVRWTCDTVARELRRFGARFVLLYRTNNPSLTDSQALRSSSPFVAAALEDSPGCGCIVANENVDVLVLTCPTSR